MLQAVERWKAEINQMIMANMQAAMAQADGYVERLEQEIMELQRRDAELRQILETEDNIHFLQVEPEAEVKRYIGVHFHSFFAPLVQNFPTLCVPPEAMVPKVLINPQFSFGEMSKTAIDMKEHLDDICKKELSKISKTGLCHADETEYIWHSTCFAHICNRIVHTVNETPVYILLPRNGDKRLKGKRSVALMCINMKVSLLISD